MPVAAATWAAVVKVVARAGMAAVRVAAEKEGMVGREGVEATAAWVETMAGETAAWVAMGVVAAVAAAAPLHANARSTRHAKL